MKNKVYYYAIQLPCNYKFDYNVAFASLDDLLKAMQNNYGQEFYIEEEIKEEFFKVRYLKAKEDNSCYARIVELKVYD